MSFNTLQSDALEKELSDLDENVSEEDGEDEEGNGEEEETTISAPSALFGPSVDMLWEKKKRRKGRTGLTAGKKLPETVSSLLGKAHEAYINGEYVTAVQLFSEVTQLAPKLPDPYSSMGLIHEEVGDRTSALRLYVVAAKLTPRAHDIWHKIACMAFELKDIPIALLAITRVMIQDKTVDTFTKKIILLVESRNIKAAEATLVKMLQHHPAEWEFLLEFGMSCQSNNYLAQSSTAYNRYIEHAVKELQNIRVQHARRSSDANAAVHLSARNSEIELCNKLFFTCRKLGELLLCLPPCDDLSPPIFSVHQLISCISSCCECARGCGLLSSSGPVTEPSWSTRLDLDTIAIPMDVVLITCACEMEEISLSARGSSSVAFRSLYHCSLHDALRQHDSGEWGAPKEPSVSKSDSKRDFRGIDSILRVLFPLLKQLSVEEGNIVDALSATKNPLGDGGLDDASWMSTHALRASALVQAPGVVLSNDDCAGSNGPTVVSEDTMQVSTQATAHPPLAYPPRELSDWLFFLRIRMWVASLLMELGLHRKGLMLSRQVIHSPFLLSALLTEHVVAELLKRHCIHAMYAMSHAPPTSTSDDLREEIMQTCMLVLQHTPSDAEILILFSSFCQKYKPDFLKNAVDMLQVHFLTLLAHFESVKTSDKDQAVFQSAIANSDMSKINVDVAVESNASHEGAKEGSGEGSMNISLSEGLKKYVHAVIDAASKEGHSSNSDCLIDDSEDDGVNQESVDIVKSKEHTKRDDQDEEEQNEEQLSTNRVRRGDPTEESANDGTTTFEVDVCTELRALVQWVQLLRDVNEDMATFSGLVLPLLEICHQHESERKSSHARKKRNRMVSVRSMWSKRSVLEFKSHAWLDNMQNSLCRMVLAFSLHVPHMSVILDKDDMVSLAGQAVAHIKEVSPDEGRTLSFRWAKSFGLDYGTSKRRLVPLPSYVEEDGAVDGVEAPVGERGPSKRRRSANPEGERPQRQRPLVRNKGLYDMRDLSDIAQANAVVREMLEWEEHQSEVGPLMYEHKAFIASLLK